MYILIYIILLYINVYYINYNICLSYKMLQHDTTFQRSHIMMLLLLVSLSLNSLVFIAAVTSTASRNFEAGTFEASLNQLKRYSSSSRIHTCHTLFSKWGFSLPSCPHDSCIQVNDPQMILIFGCVWNALSDHSSCRFYIGFLLTALRSAHIPALKGVLKL